MVLDGRWKRFSRGGGWRMRPIGVMPGSLAEGELCLCRRDGSTSLHHEGETGELFLHALEVAADELQT